jgi:hypothetical protein
MKLFKFLQRDKGLDKANQGLDRAYHRFMQEMWSFHLWWEEYLLGDKKLQRIEHEET